MGHLGLVDVYVYKLKFKDLLEGDVVYLVMKCRPLYNKRTIGMLESIDRGSDLKLSLEKGERQNDSTFHRYTERAVRKSIKIFSLEETNLADDMAELIKRMKVIAECDKQVRS